MNELATQLQIFVLSLQVNLGFLLKLVAALWGIHLINWILGYRLNIFGLYPRSGHGLLGIICSPLLHGNFNHLFFNTIPLLALANFILVGGQALFWQVTLAITLLSGGAVWLFGRSAFHVGASGVIMGYWSYILANVYNQGTFSAILIGALTLYYFGGMVSNLIPTSIKESWEGHLFGFLAGLVVAFVGANRFF